MDPLTTGLGGAALGRALPRGKAGPAATLVVTVASVLPDADIFLDLFVNDSLFGLTSHRGFTHSFVGAAVMAPLLALLFRRFTRDTNYLRLLALCGLGLLWHIWTDVNTSWGTMVYFPFSRARVSWDLVFIIDFIFTAVLLFPHLEAYIYRGQAGALRRGGVVLAGLLALTAGCVQLGSNVFGVAYRWDLLLLFGALEALLLALPAMQGWGFRQSPALFARAGLAALVIYMGICIAAHHVAVNRVERFAAARGLEVESLAALPQPLSPFRWTGLILTPEGVYQSWFNVLDGPEPAFEFSPSDQNDFVRRAGALPQVKTYLWFARFPLVRYRHEPDRHVVEYTDLRFHAPYSRRRSPFVFRVVLNDDGNVTAWGIQ